MSGISIPTHPHSAPLPPNERPDLETDTDQQPPLRQCHKNRLSEQLLFIPSCTRPELRGFHCGVPRFKSRPPRSVTFLFRRVGVRVRGTAHEHLHIQCINASILVRLNL